MKSLTQERLNRTHGDHPLGFMARRSSMRARNQCGEFLSAREQLHYHDPPALGPEATAVSASPA